jgi:hypothetical protein
VVLCGVVQATLTLILLRVIDQRDAYQGFSDPGEQQLSTCKQKLPPPFLLVCFFFCFWVFFQFFPLLEPVHKTVATQLVADLKQSRLI